VLIPQIERGCASNTSSPQAEFQVASGPEGRGNDFLISRR